MRVCSAMHELNPACCAASRAPPRARLRPWLLDSASIPSFATDSSAGLSAAVRRSRGRCRRALLEEQRRELEVGIGAAPEEHEPDGEVAEVEARGHVRVRSWFAVCWEAGRFRARDQLPNERTMRTR